METATVPKTLETLSVLTWLIAQEDLKTEIGPK
jgi:hypothetical protein